MTALNLQSPETLVPKLKVALKPFSGLKNLWRMKEYGFLPFYRDLWQNHGDLVHFKMAYFDAIFVCHPSQVREIIVEKQKDFIKGPSYDGVRLFAGNGLLTASGEDWINQRRMVKGEFTSDAIGHLHQDMCSAINKTIRHFDTLAHEKKTINIFDMMRKLAMNVVSTTLFGREFTKCEELNQAFEVLLQIAALKSITPLGAFIYLPTASNWRFLEARRKVNRITDDFITDNSINNQTLVKRLIETAKKHYQGQKLKNYLRDQVNTIFLAGHETTANTLGWIWALLANNPDIEKRLLQELDSFKGDTPQISDFCYMPLVRNIAMEALRLYPPVWALMRDAGPEATLGSIKIPKNTRMVISPYFVHRHPHFWPDPERFLPDRFNGFSDKSPAAYAYLPFSYGGRKCIGDHFANLEMSLAICMLAKRYRFTLLNALPETVAEMTLRPKTDVSMIITQR